MSLENIVANLELDVYNHDSGRPTIKAIALDDNTRYVAAMICYRGEPYNIGEDATVELIIIRPDKVGVLTTGASYELPYDDPSTEEIKVIYGAYAELDQAAIAVSGELLGQFRITSGGQVLRTQIFKINNGKALDEGQSEWAGEYDGYNLEEMATSIETNTADIATLEADVSQLKEDLRADLVSEMNPTSDTKNGVTYTWENGSCRITGTATAVTFNNLFMSSNSLPPYISAGDVLRVKYKSTNVSFIVYDYSGGTITKITEVKRDTIFRIPTTCTGLIIRLWIANGTTVNETVSPKIYINDNCLIESVDTATASESGKTDMRYIIGDMLSIYGYCQLGSGAYYVGSYINMPEGSTLEGCGESTKIYLTSGNNKAVIRMNRYCTVKDLCVIGSYDDLAQSDFSETAGTRYGVLFYKDSDDSVVPATCKISNVHIRNFTGGGIYQYGTGGNVEQGLFVSDVNIKNCWCGIWIYSNSEFCRYNNVQITYCYIACINNGGNNAFDNCVFHAYTIGMKIDGTQNNSAHGMCSNSSFCHVGDNSGSALTLADIAHGYLFSACQFWYNSIDISACGGIVFSGCGIGRSVAINVNGGNTVMFGDCVFVNDVAYPPSINITNNNKVKFTGCYGSVSGNEVTA